MRSGVLTSVHAFATDPKRGIFILAFLVLVIGGSLLLYAWRAKQVGLGGKFEVVSRESLLLSNNVLLVVAAGSVLLGTLYPLIIDALNLGKLSVGPPYFNSVFGFPNGYRTDCPLEESKPSGIGSTAALGFSCEHSYRSHSSLCSWQVEGPGQSWTDVGSLDRHHCNR